MLCRLSLRRRSRWPGRRNPSRDPGRRRALPTPQPRAGPPQPLARHDRRNHLAVARGAGCRFRSFAWRAWRSPRVAAARAPCEGRSGPRRGSLLLLLRPPSRQAARHHAQVQRQRHPGCRQRARIDHDAGPRLAVRPPAVRGRRRGLLPPPRGREAGAAPPPHPRRRAGGCSTDTDPSAAAEEGASHSPTDGSTWGVQPLSNGWGKSNNFSSAWEYNHCSSRQHAQGG